MGFTIVLKPAWIFLASLFCLVHQSDQTSQNGLEESIKDLRNLILGKLADIEYKIASMDDSLKQVNTIINNDIKPKVESVEDKVNKIETEVTAVGLSSTSQSPMLMEIKQKVENIENEVSAYGQSPSLDKVLEGPINELKSQGNAIHTSIITLSSNTLIMSTKMDTIGHEFKKGIASILLPLEEFKSQGNATLQQMKMVKQESKMYSSSVDNFTSLISNEFKQGIASVIDPLKALNSQGNTTLQEIENMKDEMIMVNQASKSYSSSVDNLTSLIRNEFKQGIALVIDPLKALNSQGNTTLQEIEYMKDEMIMVNQESKSYSSSVYNFTSQISNEFKQGIASIIDPLKALKSQGNTTLQEIKMLNDEIILFNATKLHQNSIEISNQINSIETTLNKSTEIIIKKIFECTPTSEIPKSSLTWHSVGSDNFVVFEEKKTWDNARKECMSHCLAVYEPADVVTVAKFLKKNMGDEKYWLGARGNGTHQVWASGGALSRSGPWISGHYDYVGTWISSHYNNVGTDKCLIAAAHAQHSEDGTVLGAIPCTSNLPVLCG